MGVPSGRKPEKRKRIETVIGSLKSVWTTSIAETIIAGIAADLGIVGNGVVEGRNNYQPGADVRRCLDLGFGS